MDFSDFTVQFKHKVRSDFRSNIFTGLLFIVLGLAIMISGLIRTGQFEFKYGFILIVFLFGGMAILYRAKHGLKISAHPKLVSDLELEKNLNGLLMNDNVELLEKDNNYFVLFVKPKGFSFWHEVHLLNDSSTIYINARHIWMTLIDLGTAKDLENVIIGRLNNSR